MSAEVRSELRRRLLERFSWTDGHADFAAFLADGAALRMVGSGLAAPFLGSPVDAVVGLEARGFVLGGLVAAEVGVGLVLARKAGTVHPGPKLTAVSSPDWRGRSASRSPGCSPPVSGSSWSTTGSRPVPGPSPSSSPDHRRG